MKKILILAYDFPPYVSVGGLRPYSWYKNFAKFGLYPIVVTRQWNAVYGNSLDYVVASMSNETIVEASERGTVLRTAYSPNLANRLMLKYGPNKYVVLRKVISAYFEFSQFLFNVGTKVELYKAARKYLKENNVDIIIATGEPFILFKYASMLSGEFAIPWVADYRDPWSHNNERSSNYCRKLWNIFFEKRILKSVSLITTVSVYFQNQISQLTPGKTFSIIPNGYDQDAIAQTIYIQQNRDRLSFAFIGTIYPWHPIESFLRTCNQYIKATGQDFLVNFYGINMQHELLKILECYPFIAVNVRFFPKLPNSELLKVISAHNVFILFNDYSILGTKIYDYIALRRKIIMCYSNDPKSNVLKKLYFALNHKGDENLQEELIRKTNSGIVLENEKHLYEVLESLCAEFERNHTIECDSLGYEQYSREFQVKKMVNILRELQ